ncbi:MAG: hypothetical protein QW177_09020 [Candidatus Nitrosotenuis sp.]
MLDFIIKLVLGVEISKENFRWGGLIASAIVILFGYLLIAVGNFFGIIDNLLTVSQQPWYSFYLAKFSFLMIIIKIISLSLFTTKNNTAGRFVAAFVVQFISLVGIVVLHMISNSFENLVTDTQMKTAMVILPYVLSIASFLIIRGIYEVEYFDSKKFFNSK